MGIALIRLNSVSEVLSLGIKASKGSSELKTYDSYNDIGDGVQLFWNFDGEADLVLTFKFREPEGTLEAVTEVGGTYLVSL